MSLAIQKQSFNKRPLVTVPSKLQGLAWPGLPSATEAQVLALAFQLEQSQWWSLQAIEAHQFQQLALLLEHARASSPYWANRLAPLNGLDLKTLTFDQFRRIPTLKRTEVQEQGSNLDSRHIPKEHGRPFRVTTSGSTGRPVAFPATGLSCLMCWALGMRDHLTHRRDLSGSLMAMSSSAPKAIRSWCFGLSTGPYHWVDITRPVPELLNALLEIEPDYLKLHPYTLDAIIRHSIEIGRAPQHLRQIVTFGEVLEPSTQARCQAAWGVPISNKYSTEEAGFVALQCPESDLLHVQSESLILEVLDENDQPCEVGQVGRVVATILHNFARPFIRYELGDLAEVGPPCYCGRGLPTLSRVLGRTRQLVQRPDGTLVHPKFDEDAMQAVAPIRQYQLTQSRIDLIEATLVTSSSLSTEQEQTLAKIFNQSFRHNFSYQFSYTDEIQRSQRGKFEVFRSLINAPEKTQIPELATIRSITS